MEVRFNRKGKIMNWTKASAMAEILSSVAILVTLVYLAIEIQQNTAATQAEVRQSMLEVDQQHLQLFIDDPSLNLLWYKPELTDEERVRLSYFIITHLRMRESNWLQYEAGVLDRVTWESYKGSLIAIFASPQTRTWWKNFGVQRLFDTRFIAEVDDLIEKGPIFERSPHVSTFD
ncbi:MAG: hypothetical protein ACI96M_003396 [Candidatus Azotimanducaceae bacterium]|jgi:hypothetical protein